MVNLYSLFLFSLQREKKCNLTLLLTCLQGHENIHHITKVQLFVDFVKITCYFFQLQIKFLNYVFRYQTTLLVISQIFYTTTNNFHKVLSSN